MSVQPVTSSAPLPQIPVEAHTEVHALTALFQGLSLQKAYESVRQLGVVDNSVVLVKKVVNAAMCCTAKPFSGDDLKTLKQLAREQEIRNLQGCFATESAVPGFCKMTAELTESIVRLKIAEKLEGLPKVAEDYGHYKMRLVVPYGLGWGGEYAYRQVDRRTGCRGALLDSKIGKALQRWYCAIRTYLANKSLTHENVGMFINIEHMLLKGCLELQEAQKADVAQAAALEKVGVPVHNKTLVALLQSLAIVMGSQPQFEEYLERMRKSGTISSDEALILSIEWHQKNGVLPRGIPDPTHVKLTPGVLYGELAKALHSYVSEEVLGRVLERKANPGGLSWLLYYLEVKDLLKDIGATAIVENVLEQLLNPDLLALTVLTGAGVETMDLEPDKFGLDTRKMVLKTGRKILERALDARTESSELIGIFEKSKLKNAPGNSEAIRQKQETKAQFKLLLSQMIRKAFKDDKQAGAKGGFNETLKQLPVVGSVTKGLTLLVNGMVLTWKYLSSDASSESGSFVGLMAKGLSGDPLFDLLAERIIELIYHPSWRIILMHLVDAIVQSMAGEFDTPEAEAKMQANFKTITSFLFTRVAPDALKHELSWLATRFTGDMAFAVVQGYVNKPADGAVLEKVLPIVQPTISEAQLYVRVTDSFRAKGVSFEGDAQFWQCYVREYLNRCVEAEAGVEGVRDKRVDELLKKDVKGFWGQLSKVPVKPTREPLKISQDDESKRGTPVLPPAVGGVVRLVRPEEPAPTFVMIEQGPIGLIKDYAPALTQRKKVDSKPSEDF